MLTLKTGSTGKVIPFLLINSTDHITGAISKTPVVLISKNGGNFITPAGNITEMGYGWYRLAPTATDTDTAGSLVVHAEAPGADPTDREILVVNYDPYDSSDLGLSDIGAYDLRMGPFKLNSAGGVGIKDVAIDIFKGASHDIELILLDSEGGEVSIANTTLWVRVVSAAGTTYPTQGTIVYAPGGRLTFPLLTSYTNVAGTYKIYVERNGGEDDVQIFGPLRMVVRSL
jgi:hypothetical protein